MTDGGEHFFYLTLTTFMEGYADQGIRSSAGEHHEFGRRRQFLLDDNPPLKLPDLVPRWAPADQRLLRNAGSVFITAAKSGV